MPLHFHGVYFSQKPNLLKTANTKLKKNIVFWGKKEDTPPSLPSEREKLLAEQYAKAVAARDEALERSKEAEAEFQRMTEKHGQ